MRNSLPVEKLGAENDRDSSRKPKLRDPPVADRWFGRGAFLERYVPYRKEWFLALGRAYAGISNDKEGENPSRRKPEVSWGR